MTRDSRFLLLPIVGLLVVLVVLLFWPSEPNLVCPPQGPCTVYAKVPSDFSEVLSKVTEFTGEAKLLHTAEAPPPHGQLFVFLTLRYSTSPMGGQYVQKYFRKEFVSDTRTFPGVKYAVLQDKYGNTLSRTEINTEIH